MILAIAGLSMVSLIAQAIDSARLVGDREREQADESRLLAAETLLTRGDLDIRLGTRTEGPYIVVIGRPERTLYRIAIGRQEAPGVEDLVTVVFRGSSQ